MCRREGKQFSAGGRLTRRFRPEDQAASTAQPARRHQWQESGDVSISGSEAGPAGGAPPPDDDPSMYTRRSTRFAPHFLWLRASAADQTPFAGQQMLQLAILSLFEERMLISCGVLYTHT